MGIYYKHLRDYIIQPALKSAGWWSDSAQNLVLGTAIQESNCGQYLKQISGPALGIYQTEPNTLDDLYNNYINGRPYISDILKRSGVSSLSYDALVYNLYYATLICRLIYFRVPELLPANMTVEQMARWYKQYYNTPNGKATEQQFIINYERIVNERD